MTTTTDTRFSDAVYAAAQGRQPDELAALLRSDLPLGAGEREMLAQLVEGALQRPANRPRGKSHKADIQVAAGVEYLTRTENGEKAASVEAELCERYAVKRGTLLSWVAELRKSVEERDGITCLWWSAASSHVSPLVP